jgi:HK97 family phage major capsid protein
MKLTRLHFTFGLLVVLAVLAVFAISGNPLVDPAVLAGLGAMPMAMGDVDAKQIKELLEKQGQAFDEFKKTNDAHLKAKADGTAISDLEAKLTKLNGVFEATQEVIKEIQKRANRPGTGGDVDPVKAEHKQAFGKFLRKGVDDGLGTLQQKAYNITTDADGGFAVHEELDRDI